MVCFWGRPKTKVELAYFPLKNQAPNIVLSTLIVKLENWKTNFRKFGKFEERSSKFLEIGKLEDFQMNDTKNQIAHFTYL